MEDKVNSPKHYTSDPSGIECIQIARHRNFNIGNAIKYLWRQGIKSESNMTALNKQIEDLNKAVWYIVDEIHRLGGTCTVITDPESIKRLPTNNDDIITTTMNYNKEIDGKSVSILGLSNNNDDIKHNIKYYLDTLINELSKK